MSERNSPAPDTDPSAPDDSGLPPSAPDADWAEMPSTPLDDYHMVEGRDFGHRDEHR